MAETKLRIYCPAKVNLFLAVGPRDARGYHPLRTIFQAVDLCDVLEVSFGGQGFQRVPPRIDVVGCELPTENTLAKTLRLSREIFAMQPTQTRLEKHIPMQSGLGGGSSDAAGLLRALQAANHQLPAANGELESVASAVGADVSFFLTGGRARGEGYGERITPLPDAGQEWYVLAKPPIGCSTSEMYAKLDQLPREWRDWPDRDVLYNDFERVAPPECLELIELMRNLGARDSALSGSGSSVFGRFSSRNRADQAKGLLLSMSLEVWSAKSLTRSESLRIEYL